MNSQSGSQGFECSLELKVLSLDIMGFPYVGITYCVGGLGIFGVWRILSREMGTVVFGLKPPPLRQKSLS